MAYGFNDDLTKVVVVEAQSLAINETFTGQSTRNVTYTLPAGWDVANTVIAGIGINWYDSQFYYGTLYGNLEGSAYDGWIIRASVIKDGNDDKVVLTLKYKQAYTGELLGSITLLKIG